MKVGAIPFFFFCFWGPYLSGRAKRLRLVLCYGCIWWYSERQAMPGIKSRLPAYQSMCSDSWTIALSLSLSFFKLIFKNKKSNVILYISLEIQLCLIFPFIGNPYIKAMQLWVKCHFSWYFEGWISANFGVMLTYMN